jgi:hypothetical protein
MDFDRITHPLRLASGSHLPGSGKGCAMNVIADERLVRPLLRGVNPHNGQQDPTRHTGSIKLRCP